jgi:hypothetical protein
MIRAKAVARIHHHLVRQYFTNLGLSFGCFVRQTPRCNSLQDLILESESNPFGVIFLEPCFSGIDIGKYPKMVGIADLLARVCVDEDCHVWSLLSFRYPQCESFFSAHSLRSGFLTSAAAKGASIFKMMDQSGHMSIDTLRGYVRDAELFKDHAGAGML